MHHINPIIYDFLCGDTKYWKNKFDETLKIVKLVRNFKHDVVDYQKRNPHLQILIKDVKECILIKNDCECFKQCLDIPYFKILIEGDGKNIRVCDFLNAVIPYCQICPHIKFKRFTSHTVHKDKIYVWAEFDEEDDLDYYYHYFNTPNFNKV